MPLFADNLLAVGVAARAVFTIPPAGAAVLAAPLISCCPLLLDSPRPYHALFQGGGHLFIILLSTCTLLVLPPDITESPMGHLLLDGH